MFFTEFGGGELRYVEKVKVGKAEFLFALFMMVVV